MKRYFLIAYCLFWLCPTYTAAAAGSHKIKFPAQDLATKELAAQILIAYGGEKKFKEVYEEGWHGFGKYTQISLLSGVANSFDIEIFNKGDKVRQQMTVLGDQLVGGFDGKHSWLKQFGEVIEDNSSKTDLAREEIDHGLHLLLKLSAKNTKLEIKNSQDSNDVLSVTTDDGTATLLYADKKTHLVTATEFVGIDDEQGLSVAKSFKYEDYRPCAGTMLAYKFTESSGGKKVLEVTLNSIKQESLADSIFVVPKDRQCLLNKNESVTIPFSYIGGEIVINASVNGRPGLAFVVDTAATQSLIDRKLALQLGEIENSDLSITTGSGSVPMGYMKLASLTMGTLAFKDIPMAVTDLAPLKFAPVTKIAGLLGANLLRQFLITFDFSKQTITLGHPDNTINDKEATIISAKPSLGGSALMVDGELDGKKLACLIDTGAAYSIIPHELAVQLASNSVPGLNSVRGLDGKRVRVATGQFKVLKLGTVSIEQPEFLIPSQTVQLGGMIANGSVAILGNPIWKNFVLTLDYKRQRIILRRSLCVSKS
jgi:predicted aspartyl protease